MPRCPNLTNIPIVAQFDPLPLDFYDRDDVVSVARELLGQWIVTRFNGKVTAGRIVETEAYAGITDRASHAWNNRRTSRTEVMFGPPGHAYVYLCYGMHQLFNVVTNRRDVPHAILIRGIEPFLGLEHMAQRTGKKPTDAGLTRGPGNLAKALDITIAHSGTSLMNGTIIIAKGDQTIDPSSIIATPRIGVAYAGMDALLPYRFLVRNNPYVSGTKPR